MKPRLRTVLPELITALAWMLPLLVPYAAGLWWLYRNQYLLAWVLTLLGVSLLLAVIARIARRRDHGIQMPETDADAADAEKRARAAVQEIVKHCGPEDVASAKTIETLIRNVLAAVAGAWNPGASHAELRFTLPEALTLTEHLSARLRRAIREDLPALQHVQIAHVMQINRGIKPAQTLWRYYRIGRFLYNPLGSAVAELRRGVMQTLTPMAVESVKGKAAALLARETGEAAILLYSGRLRREMDRLASDTPAPAAEPDTGPLTLLVAGQPNAGKSSLINALSGRDRAVVSPLPCAADFTAYALEQETAGDLVILDSPGLTAAPGREWIREAARADLILWVAAAHRADRAADQAALAALRTQSEIEFRKRRAPMLLVLTHADRLDPAAEWNPPYDPDHGTRPKEKTLRAARDAAAKLLGFPAERILPVMVRNHETAWNLETLWQAVHRNLPAARRARLERLLLRRSRLEGIRDTARTLPGLLKQFKNSL
jgi:predicted GTPase